LSATIIYFSGGPSTLDVDNMVKPIFDALNKFVWLDDSQVAELTARITDRTSLLTFRNPTPPLAAALVAPGPFIYVRLSDDPIRHEELPR
jgi:Endodeoxyribonuclease RusA